MNTATINLFGQSIPLEYFILLVLVYLVVEIKYIRRDLNNHVTGTEKKIEKLESAIKEVFKELKDDMKELKGDMKAWLSKNNP